MPDVFLSYSRGDQAVARRFAEGLEREGFSVWWDQALEAGEAFDRVTERALAEARAVVVLWSKRSVESDWVRAEATQARAGNRLVPVQIEACKRPIMFELTQTADLTGWHGDGGDPRWQAFIGGLRRSVGRSGGAASGVHAAPASRPVAGTGNTGRSFRWIGVPVAAVAIVAGLGWYLLHGRSPGTPVPIQASIAVLPFDDLSPGKDQGYFADGVAEEILNSLARIDPKQLKVIARNSAFQFRGGADLREVGEKLGVEHVLEGSVRKDGEQLRITAQLISARSNAHLWSRTWDRPRQDLFAVQEEIARSIAGTLQITLGVGIGQQPGGTRNVDAYEAYLAARAIPAEFAVNTERRRIGLLQRALSLDPAFAGAWAMLARSYGSVIGVIGRDHPDAAEWLQKAEAAQKEVERLLPAEAERFRRASDFGRLVERGRWVEAAKLYLAAVRPAGPDDAAAQAPAFDPFFRLYVGRPGEALPLMEQQNAYDPLNQSAAFALAWTYGTLGDFAAAFREFERGETLQPTDRFRLRSTAAVIALAANDRQRLRRWLEAASAAEKEINSARTGFHTRMLGLLDRPDEARAWLRADLQNAIPLAKAGYAHYLAWLGDKEGALQALREGFQPGAATSTAFGMWTPDLSEVRKTPGFRQLMRDVGLVDFWKEYGWGDYCKPADGTDDFECR